MAGSGPILFGAIFAHLSETKRGFLILFLLQMTGTENWIQNDGLLRSQILGIRLSFDA